MPLSRNIGMYKHVESLFITALENAGAQIALPTPKACIRLRAELYMFRKLWRDQEALKPFGDPAKFDDFSVEISETHVTLLPRKFAGVITALNGTPVALIKPKETMPEDDMLLLEMAQTLKKEKGA